MNYKNAIQNNTGVCHDAWTDLISKGFESIGITQDIRDQAQPYINMVPNPFANNVPTSLPPGQVPGASPQVTDTNNFGVGSFLNGEILGFPTPFVVIGGLVAVFLALRK